jgi:(4S)-4-hydroxy-5-phosphonooxypentane-2,3-dione isomerase
MSVFTITVEFAVEPGSAAAFLEHMLANAQASLENEPGCLRFDVLQPEGAGDRVFLYEIYRDRAAFDAHATSPHYLAFAEATQSMVRQKTVEVLRRLNPAASGG